jgi:predicted DNA-binding transcriptional regulator AlpA
MEVSMTRRLIRIDGLKAKLPLSTPTIYRKMAEGVLPRPIPIGAGGAVAWVEEEVDAAIDRMIADAGDRAPQRGGPGRSARKTGEAA